MVQSCHSSESGPALNVGDGVPRCQSGPLSSRPREGEGGEGPGDSQSGQRLQKGERVWDEPEEVLRSDTFKRNSDQYSIQDRNAI